MKTMKTLAKLKSEPGIWLHEAEQPELGHNDLLIKIRKTAICGTDIHIYNWDEWSQNTIPVPMTVGHEYVGVVTAIGKEVSGFEIGDRVSGEGHITCGHCRNCRAGRRHLDGHLHLGLRQPGGHLRCMGVPPLAARDGRSR